MTDLIAHIREVIDQHGKRDYGGELGCSCGATHISDHPSHVAQAIIDRLGLRRESVGAVKKDVKEKVRYVSAVFDEELTILEGAE
jgi:hypothetical protein